MSGFRITPLIVAIIGSVLCLTAALLLFFLLVKPTQVQISDQQALLTGDAAYVDPAGGIALKQAQDALTAAQAQVAAVQKQWGFIERTKNPNIDVSDRFHAWRQWTNELESDFAPRVQSFLSHTGVTPLTKVSAPVPTSDPNLVPTTLIAMPLGTISVFGSYGQILKHVAAWNRFDRIVMVDQLALSGYSPFITANYTATEYIFPRNSDNPGPPVPSPTGGADAVPPGMKAPATPSAAPPTEGAPGMPSGPGMLRGPGAPGAPGAPGMPPRP